MLSQATLLLLVLRASAAPCGADPCASIASNGRALDGCDIPEYEVDLVNSAGQDIYFKIGGGEMPMLCQSTGVVPNPSWPAGATYTIKTNGAEISPTCVAACPNAQQSDGVSAGDSMCSLPGTPCSCIYKAPPDHCEAADLCGYCKPGLRSQMSSDGSTVVCDEATDLSPVYKLDAGSTAEIRLSGDASTQRLISDRQNFGWKVFDAEKHQQTMIEITFAGGIISPDISLIPSGCDDVPHPGSPWQSNTGWGTIADCGNLPVNQATPQCPRCADNKIGPAFNFGVELSCKGGNSLSCRGPVEGSFGSGGGWPSYCGNPDATCNPDCPQAYFHPRFTPAYGSDAQPSTTCGAGSKLTAQLYA